MTTLNVVLRGQSNAMHFTNAGAVTALDHKIEQYLGFDGITNNINIVADIAPWRTVGNYTINDGTGFVTAINQPEYPNFNTNWIAPKNGDWTQGWTNLELEAGFLNRLTELSKQPAAETAILWLHSEYDSQNPGLSTDQWVSAVRYDAAQVRAIFGGDPAHTPYLFVDALPYSPGIPTINQAIKQGMETLALDSSFKASIAAQPYDLNMDGDKAGSYGGSHMSASDANYLVDRLARSLAQEFAEYALPTSPVGVAGGGIANFGPQVVSATLLSDNLSKLVVEVRHDAATSFGSLNAIALSGLGWSLRGSSGNLANVVPTSVSVVDSTHLALTFSADISALANSGYRLFYAYGYGRLAESGKAGQNNAIYDDLGLPLWTSAYGTSLTVAQAVNKAPVLVGSGLPDQSVKEDVAFTFDASKAFADPNGDQLSYSVVTASPHWLQFNNGVFSGTPWDKTAGTFTVTVKATDPSGLSVSDTFNIVVADNPGVVWTGGSKNDRKTGTSGQDRLDGGDGADVINGAGGSDWIVGGKGKDNLTGGTGWDTFLFQAGSGQDIITDFHVHEDRLLLEGLSISSVQEINTDRKLGNDATLVTFSDGSTVRLQGVLGLGPLDAAVPTLTTGEWFL